MLLNTVNPLLSPPPGGLFISNTFEEGLNRDRGLIWEEAGGGGGGLFNLAKMMASVLHKALEYKVERLKYKKLDVMQPRIKNKSDLPVGE